jgi:hypothetical protein
MHTSTLRCMLLGVGAMRSPKYAPAGLLVEYAGRRVAIDGGGAPLNSVDAWLVTDERAELISQLRRLARASGVTPRVDEFRAGGLTITPRRVVHTSHPAFGYAICVSQGRVVWAPEFLRFPRWAADADLMFAEAAAISRPILFASGAGGHATALMVARTARKLKVKRVGPPRVRAARASSSNLLLAGASGGTVAGGRKATERPPMGHSLTGT